MKKKEKIDLSKLNPRQLRSELFNIKTVAENGEDPNNISENDIYSQIEKMEFFDGWENFNVTWDVLWVGLDPRYLIWVEGRHNSPTRKIVQPVRLVQKDARSGKMICTSVDKKDIQLISVPFKEPLPETDQDRAISNKLSGKSQAEIEESIQSKEEIKALEDQMKDMIKKMQEIKNKK